MWVSEWVKKVIMIISQTQKQKKWKKELGGVFEKREASNENEV